MKILSTDSPLPRFDLFRPLVVCGRYPGQCPVIDLSSVSQLYCPRCNCVTPYSPTTVSFSAQ
jgi:hypothetical protein